LQDAMYRRRIAFPPIHALRLDDEGTRLKSGKAIRTPWVAARLHVVTFPRV